MFANGEHFGWICYAFVADFGLFFSGYWLADGSLAELVSSGVAGTCFLYTSASLVRILHGFFYLHSKLPKGL